MLQRAIPVRQAAKTPPAAPDPGKIMWLDTGKWLVNASIISGIIRKIFY